MRLFASRIADAVLEGQQMLTEGGATAEAPEEGEQAGPTTETAAEGEAQRWAKAVPLEAEQPAEAAPTETMQSSEPAAAEAQHLKTRRSSPQAKNKQVLIRRRAQPGNGHPPGCAF